MLLKDKVIFLTGGASGIGFECAKAYVKEGARLSILDRDANSVGLLIQAIGPDHLTMVGDVSDGMVVENAIQQTLDKFVKIDAIHNNAGIAQPSKALHETTDEEWDKVININLKSILHTTRSGFEALRRSKGCILNTSSLVGEIGQEIHAAYSASKGGVNALTKSMALDYAPLGIRVNAIAPAGVWTPMLRHWSSEQPNADEIVKYLDNIHALGYCPDGDVIADAAVFLMSDKSRFITGCILPVSGGAELGYKK
jgi:meso-butanediol dehydrogenase / (S,S)-butanediol dehydrogenase / diacetyl reductase